MDAIIVAGAIALAFLAGKGKMIKTDEYWEEHGYMELYEKYAPIANVDPLILKSIAIIESSENHLAINENEGRGRISVGLMQILYPTTLEALNRIYGTTYTKNDLFNPDANVHLACLLLKDIKAQGYTTLSDMVASYNAGRPRWVGSQYSNQEYVDRFYRTYGRFLDGPVY